uniref:Uncharacterized protein n=1 Tax=Anguilla anguilla TaxID=7936 RepID=A0A0E9TIF7_ANGAN
MKTCPVHIIVLCSWEGFQHI